MHQSGSLVTDSAQAAQGINEWIGEMVVLHYIAHDPLRGAGTVTRQRRTADIRSKRYQPCDADVFAPRSDMARLTRTGAIVGPPALLSSDSVDEPGTTVALVAPLDLVSISFS